MNSNKNGRSDINRQKFPRRRRGEDAVDYWTRAFGQLLKTALNGYVNNSEQKKIWLRLSKCAQIFGKITGEKERQSDLDSRTNLPNAKTTLRMVSQMIAMSLKLQTNCALIFVDIDNFKKYNDQHGHEAGNQVITKVVQITINRINSNLISGAFVGRYGGEEFIIGLPFANAAQAKSIAQQCRQDTQQKTQVTCSYGIAMYKPKQQERPRSKDLIERANVATHVAKGKGEKRTEGKNKVVVWSNRLPKKVMNLYGKGS